LARFDIDAPVVEIGGVAHRQVLRCAETYFASSGPVRVERSLYSTRQAGDRAVCPLELRAGMIVSSARTGLQRASGAHGDLVRFQTDHLGVTPDVCD
jgi:hypothetical protein